MSVTKITIDGIDATGDLAIDTDGFELVYQLNKDNFYEKSTAQTLVFVGDTFTYLENRFLGDCAINQKSDVSIFTKCGKCERQTDLVIYFTDIDSVCTDICQIEVSPRSESPESLAAECLKASLFWEGDEFQNTLQHPQFIHVGNDGYRSPMYLLQTIFEHNAVRCGLDGFESSILVDDPVYCGLGIFGVQYALAPQTATNFDFDNRISLTTFELMQKIEPVLNGRFRIEDDLLKFERRDFWDTITEVSYNVHDLYTQGCMEEAPCFKYYEDERSKCSYFRGEYATDSIDVDFPRYWEYSDLIEWNPNNENPSLTDGECAVDNCFSALDYGLNGGTGDPQWRFRLSNGMASELKLGIWDKASGYTDAAFLECGGIPSPYLSFRESLDGLAGCDDSVTLYNRFHFIDDPRVSGTTSKLQVDNIEFVPPDFCDFWDKVEEFGIRMGLDSKYGVIKVGTFKINPCKGIVQAENLTILCTE